MKLTVLVENVAMENVRSAHGLSLYIETGAHTLLFDFGPDGDLLLENAEKLGADLEKVDAAFLSHGHYDHAGGLEAFLRVNSSASVYAHALAFRPHLALKSGGLKSISADATLPERYPERFVFTEGLWPVDETLTLFSDVPGRELLSRANGSLFEEEGGRPVPDRFRHEQNLLIREGGTLTLVAGCAHRGIVNILRAAETAAGRAPDRVFSGFHLMNPDRGEDEPEAFVRAVGEALRAYPSLYGTGHCTGQGPYRILQEQLGERLVYMGCGRRFEI